MKIIAWNINGIRAILKKKDFTDLINEENPDIFCLGEIKMNCPFTKVQEEINEKLNEKYNYYWSECIVKKGYSGTAIYTKKKPLSVVYGLNDLDNEGRVITCEFKNYYLVHVYTPNSGEALARLDYRVTTWDTAFSKFINKLQDKKKVIVCGDLNVAHKEIDLKNPKTNLNTAGFTIDERNSFNKILENNNLIDTYRYKNPEEVKYSYWSYRFNSRNKNIGWRIDYFLVSKSFIKKVIKSDILDDIKGSDHAPIILEIK